MIRFIWLWHFIRRRCPMPPWVRYSWEKCPHEGIRWACRCGRVYERESVTLYAPLPIRSKVKA